MRPDTSTASAQEPDGHLQYAIDDRTWEEGVRVWAWLHSEDRHGVWSPDGRRIAFTSVRHASRGRLEMLGPAFELYTMRADGRNVRRITHNRVPDLHPNWRPVR